MKLPHQDELLLQRYRDGELSTDEAARLRHRLDAEPALRAALTGLEELSGLFATGKAAAAFAAPAGFTAQVLAEARRLPDRIRLREAEASARAVVVCRRLLLAAVVLFGIGLLWHSGLFRPAGSDVLTATPDDVDREMQRLDAIVHDWNSALERRHR